MRITTHRKLRKKLGWMPEDWPIWTWNYNLPSIYQWIVCKLLGHLPISDMCDNPEHDYCAWCAKSMPGQSIDRE